MGNLSISEIYNLVTNAGFPPETAASMTAIALRESGGNPLAFANNASERSYGLFQINMKGSLGQQRLRQLGLNSENDLLDPAVNARAAFEIWNGNDANLETAWYINRPGYMEKFQGFLDEVKTALGFNSNLDDGVYYYPEETSYAGVGVGVMVLVGIGLFAFALRRS